MRAKKRRKLNYGASLPVLSLSLPVVATLVRSALLRPLDPPDRLVPVLSFFALTPTVPPPARLCLLSLFVLVFSFPRCTIIEFPEL